MASTLAPAVAAGLAAVYFIGATVLPTIRPYWKGMKVRFGTLSCIGFAIGCTVLATGFDMGPQPPPIAAVLIALFVVGLITSFVGLCRDRRAFDESARRT